MNLCTDVAGGFAAGQHWHLACSDQGQYCYCGAFALAGLQEVCNGGFGFVQPAGCCPGIERSQWIVIGVVSLALELGEYLGEGLGVG